MGGLVLSSPVPHLLVGGEVARAELATPIIGCKHLVGRQALDVAGGPRDDQGHSLLRNCVGLQRVGVDVGDRCFSAQPTPRVSLRLSQPRDRGTLGVRRQRHTDLGLGLGRKRGVGLSVRAFPVTPRFSLRTQRRYLLVSVVSVDDEQVDDRQQRPRHDGAGYGPRRACASRRRSPHGAPAA
eukprot:scaffold110467_cov63-Phaeocystis_antarctica.AAC.3